MAAALYEPDLGYYSAAKRPLGRSGDFFTSVSVGPLFGALLARRFLKHWLEAGSPSRWRIIESGAHDGRLAADVLDTIAMLDTQAFLALEYVIPEPLPALQAAQRVLLAPFQARLRLVTNPLEIADNPLPGIAFGNELLDALPCHVVVWNGHQWFECQVTIDSNGGFAWETQVSCDPVLLSTLASLGTHFPPGYRTEVRTQFGDLLAPLARSLVDGLMIWIDYGFARADYYHPNRTAGTLRTFAKHRADDNPLENPGTCDITAHVDFTAVAEAAIALGGRPIEFCSQGTWLTTCGRSWLLEQEGQPQSSSLRQFQTLTHPAHLGSRFQVLELSWNPRAVPHDSRQLAHRLFASIADVP